MLKKLNFFVCFFYLFFSCSEQNAYRIKVDISNLNAQDIFVVYEAAESKKVDTISYAGNGAFVFMFDQDDYRTVTLYYDNFSRWFTIYLEKPQRIVVSGDALSPRLLRVKGGRINELLSEFRTGSVSLLKEQMMLSNANDSIQDRLTDPTIKIARLATIKHELRFQAEAFIEKNPNEEASAILIKEYFTDPNNPLLMDNLLNILYPRLDDFYVVQDLKNYTEKAKQTIVGAKAPDFNVRNIDGQTFNRDSFLNRYFILAFTTIWSDMCQTEELHLDEIISSYSKDSLSVLFVSLDENPQEIRNSIRKDSIQWNIVTDSIGQAIRLLDVYNVNILPHCFLMDKEGYIMLKTENGEELKQMLEQLMPKSVFPIVK
jgi:peroxiredoxin